MRQISKQEKWQEKQRQAGKCACDNPLFTKWHCEECAIKQREAARARYRKKVGKPVNDPLANGGRKRIEEIEK